MSRPVSRPVALLFDWDNTLVDSWGLLHLCMNETLDGMGQEAWSLDQVRQRLRSSLRDSFPHLFGLEWQKARSLYYASYERHRTNLLQVLPGAEALLKAAAQAGIYMAVISNKTGCYLRKEVAQLGWQGYFSQVVGAQDASADKPDPAVVRLALSSSGVTPGRHVWFVGDTNIDMQCAVNAGCLPVLVGGDRGDDFSAFDPMLRTETLDVLRRYVVQDCEIVHSWH